MGYRAELHPRDRHGRWREVPGASVGSGGVKLHLRVASPERRSAVGRGHTVPMGGNAPQARSFTVSGGPDRAKALRQRGYTARVGAAQPAPYEYPYTGPAGTHTVDGVSYWESETAARSVAAGLPRSRVVKRRRGWVIITASGRPHNVTRMRPFRGNTWADPYGDIDEFGRTIPQVREARARAAAVRLDRKLDEILREDQELAERVAVREAKDSLIKASTPEPFSHSKTSNWVARGGGLPAYVQHIAHDLMEKRGKSESQAIQMAIGIVKRWARGGGNVDANTRAAAAKAVAEWEALKAKAHARPG